MNDIQEHDISIRLILLSVRFITFYFIDFERDDKSLHLKNNFEQSSV